MAADILVIDDERLVFDSISNVVRQMGHLPNHARSIKEGLDIIRSRAFDIVFLDVRLLAATNRDVEALVRQGSF